MLETAKLNGRSDWFAYRRSGRQTHPISWQGWLLTLAYAFFVIAMVGLAAEAGGAGFSVGVAAVLFVAFAVTVFYLSVISRHTRPRS